jgi:hypothetical protein
VIPRIDDGYVALYDMDGMISFRPRFQEYDRSQLRAELTSPIDTPKSTH